MCPKNPIILLSLVLTTAFTASPGAAETFTVELPGLVGAYQGGGFNWPYQFDLGVSFTSIDEVRIGWTGTITPGTAHGDGVEIPWDEWFEWDGQFFALLDPPGSGRWTAAVGDSSFSTEQPFSSYGATWDFLLDGAGEIDVNLESAILFGGVGVTPPSGELSTAYLVIEGIAEGDDIPTVSQWGMVAMVLLVLTAGTLVYTRRRRPVSLDRA